MSAAFDQITQADDGVALSSPGEAQDFFALLKPRVMFLVIVTALGGMVAAPGSVNPVIGFAALLAISVGAGASGCLNMWWDADIDAVMAAQTDLVEVVHTLRQVMCVKG